MRPPIGGNHGSNAGGAPLACPVVQFGSTWVESSPWVCKKIFMMNSSGGLQQQIQLDAVVGVLSVMPEGTAIGFLKELEAQSQQIPDPTSWLVTTATNYANGQGQAKEGSMLSRKVG